MDSGLLHTLDLNGSGIENPVMDKPKVTAVIPCYNVSEVCVDVIARYRVHAANYSSSPIPEPMTLTVMGLGGLVLLRRRRRRSRQIN